jgi:NAD+ synthase (glutamine-hydrolysing)
LATGDIDLDRIAQDRMRTNSFGQSIARHAGVASSFRSVTFSLALPSDATLPLERSYERFPYVPADPATRDERCHEVYEIQVQGLVKRLKAMKSDQVVIGISGGLDSTQALIVCARAMDVMGLPRRNILAYTMPGFATSERTLDQSRRLMSAVDATAREVDIRPSCLQMFKDIGHPFAEGRPVYDVTFENVQAGERTSHLFRLANVHNAPVVGTSDLSELALGYCTLYGDTNGGLAVIGDVLKTEVYELARAYNREQEIIPEAIISKPPSAELAPGQLDAQSLPPYERLDPILKLYFEQKASPEEIIGKPVFLLIPPERYNDCALIMQKVQKGASVKHYETTRLRKDGTRIVSG